MDEKERLENLRFLRDKVTRFRGSLEEYERFSGFGKCEILGPILFISVPGNFSRKIQYL